MHPSWRRPTTPSRTPLRHPPAQLSTRTPHAILNAQAGGREAAVARLERLFAAADADLPPEVPEAERLSPGPSYSSSPTSSSSSSTPPPGDGGPYDARSSGWGPDMGRSTPTTGSLPADDLPPASSGGREGAGPGGAGRASDWLGGPMKAEDEDEAEGDDDGASSSGSVAGGRKRPKSALRQ
jgi:hypothetical protein